MSINIISVLIYCGVAPKGPLLTNGYASGSGFIGNGLNVHTATRGSSLRTVA
jgi:hypothetical protein